MAIELVITELRNYLQSISRGSIINFESAFASKHMKWHVAENRSGIGTFNDHPIGFLSFHHEVVSARNRLCEKLGATPNPIWRGENNPPGTPAGPYPAYPGTWIKRRFGNEPPLSALSDPHIFSQYFETWHNEVHSNEMYPEQFGDPQTNVHMPLFWSWHALIEETFLTWLASKGFTYDGIDHANV